MKIYFCDICNESIPLKDLNEGGCLAIKGKMICRSCNPFPPSSGRSAFATWTAVGGAAVAIAALGLSLWLIVDRQTDAPKSAKTTSSTREELSLLEQRLAGLEEQIARLETPSEPSMPVDAFADLEARQKTGARRIAETDEKVEAVRELLDRQEDVKRRVETLTVELRDVAGQLIDLRSRQASTGLAVEALEARLENVGTISRPVEGSNDGDVAPTPVAEPELDGSIFEERTRSLLAQLEAGNPSVRFNAVDELLRLGDARLVPWFIDRLQDDDMFVRYLIAEGLAELGRKDAAPALIERLADDESIVRDSAHRSLEALLGVDVAYDPNGTAEERKAGIGRWRKAWDSAGD